MPCSLYRHFSATDELLYVGISLSAVARLGQHERHSGWFGSIASVKVEHFDTREEALAAEKAAIQGEDPLHNKYHKRHKRHKQPTKPSLFEVEEAETAADKSKQRLIHRIVNIRPLYNLAQTAGVLNISQGATKKLIEDGELGAVILRRNPRHFKGVTKVYKVYGVTGWQIIDYLETLEQTGVSCGAW